MSFASVLFEPHLIRQNLTRLIKKSGVGSYEARLNLGILERPHYGYCIFNAAKLAHKLGLKKISIIEFGVAGGNGLVNIEYHVGEIEKLIPVEIEIYGFDTGEGLPEPIDFRDLPYHWKKGFFKMDLNALQSRIKRAKLVLGDIRETAHDFFEKYNPAPIGVVMHDFDFYSSTEAALRLFEADDKYFLPRIFNYFDDIIGDERELYNDYTGQRLAINEFNEKHEFKKFTVPYYLLARRLVEPWYHQIFIYHNFKHNRYNDFISEENQQLALNTNSK
jgi:hypothetical protein